MKKDENCTRKWVDSKICKYIQYEVFLGYGSSSRPKRPNKVQIQSKCIGNKHTGKNASIFDSTTSEHISKS